MTPATSCDHWTTGTGYCGATPTRRYLNGVRCPMHTPAKVAGRDDVTPHIGSLAWFLTRAGRRAIDTPATAHALIDDRAIASGKARKGSHAYREAVMREAERRGTKKPAPAVVEPPPASAEQPGLWDLAT